MFPAVRRDPPGPRNSSDSSGTVAFAVGRARIAADMVIVARPGAYPLFSCHGRSMPVVIVESPAKAKTINKYLGANYEVIASYGHVRDLPAKDGSVDPDQDFAMLWDVDG